MEGEFSPVFLKILLVGRRDSNPRPSAPKFNLLRNFNDLAGAVGAVSNAKERVETFAVGLNGGRILPNVPDGYRIVFDKSVS